MMRRQRKKPVYVIVGDAVYCIDKNRVLDRESDLDDSLGEELQCPTADEVLIGLRKAFTLSFPINPFIDGLTQSIAEIRRVCVNALRDIPEVLSELGLPAIPPVSDDTRRSSVKIATCYFARATDLRIRVLYEGRRQSLFPLIQPAPADAIIRTAREIVTATFSEMHSEEQHEAVLLQIRNSIWDILPPFNKYLIPIDVEPIAARCESEDE
jgi:hypothetical protein